VTELDNTLTANLSNINAGVSLTAQGSVTTGDAVVLAADLSTVDALEFIMSGTGTLAITGSTIGAATTIALTDADPSTGAVFTLSAAQAAGKTVTGTGNVTVSALQASAGANLGNFDAALNVTAEASSEGNGTLTANMGRVDTLSVVGSSGTLTIGNTATLGSETAITVAGTAALSLSAATANGRTITGTGNVAISALNTTPGSLLTALDSGLNVTAQLTAVSGSTVTLNSDLSLVDTIDVTGNGNLVLGAAAQVAGTIELDGGSLTLTAAQAHGLTSVTGTQTVTVNALQSQTDAVLNIFDDAFAVTVNLDASTSSTITADLRTVDTLAITGSGTVTMSSAQLDAATVITVGSTATLLIAEALVDGRTISGAGKLTIDGVAADTSLNNVTVTGDVTGNVTTSIDVEAGVTGVDIYSVAVNQTLTIASSVFEDAAGTGITVTGSGAVNVSGASVGTTYDLTDITTAQTSKITFSDAGTLSASTVLSGSSGEGVDQVDLAGGTQMTAVQANGIAFGGTGAVTVTGAAGDQVLSGTANDDSFAGGLGVDTIDLSDGGVDTIVFTAETVGAEASSDIITGFVGGSGAGADKFDFTTAMVDTIDASSLQVHSNDSAAITGNVLVFDTLPIGTAGNIELLFNIGAGAGDPINDLLAASGKSEAILILAESTDDGSDANIWHWTDGRGTTGGEATDDRVQFEEMDKLGTMSSFDLEDLSGLIQSNLITG